MNSTTHKNQELLLTALLVGIALQGLNVLAMSALGILAWCWVGGILILLGLITFKARLWQTSAPEDWIERTAPWRSPWPWLIGLLLTIQIVAYPPTMADSLSYRLPRLFLALQDGGIGRFPTDDDRINGMPWGWEFLALPFASLNYVNGSKWINLAGWAIVFTILFTFARHGGATTTRARWIALALSTAPVFLLQAASTANDLYAATLLLIGVWMIHRFQSAPGPIPVMASLLALVLAANAKPQFLVLGLPWLIWWALAPGKPWKQNAWHTLAIAAPLFFLVSPLWLLFENHQLTGNLLAASEGTGLTHKAPAWMMAIAGTIQFTSAQFQLPIFPGAESFSSILKSLPGFQTLGDAIPKFSPGVQQLIIVDGASLGLVHFALLGTGIALCIRKHRSHPWTWIAVFAFGFIIAVSQVVPSTIGRSFLGFFSLLLPMAAIGLATWQVPPAPVLPTNAMPPRGRCLRLLLFKSKQRNSPLLFQVPCLIAVLTGTAAIILNPASPLWPSKTLESIAEKHEIQRLANALDHYNGYLRRAETGTGILDPVPHGETVGALIRRVTPMSPLWQPDWRAHRIEFIGQVDPATFHTGETHWLLIAENASHFLPEKTEQYANLPGWQIVHQITYLPNLRQGPETWTLYHRSDE